MKNVLVFVLGAAAGSLVTWKLVDEKYKRLAQEEIDEVREYYKGKKTENDEIKTHHVASGPKPWGQIEPDELTHHEYVDRDNYSKVLTGLGYSEEEAQDLAEDPDVSIEKNEDGEYEVFMEPPSKTEAYVISPEEFGDEPGYGTENWTLYADGILTNDDDEIVDEDEMGLYIGDALNHFGEYEDDSVHVRNDNDGFKCDIEILRLSRTYDEAHGGESHVDDVR